MDLNKIVIFYYSYLFTLNNYGLQKIKIIFWNETNKQDIIIFQLMSSVQIDICRLYTVDYKYEY